MIINIENYLSDEEIKEIIKEELREKIKDMFKNERETSRIITNLGYYNTFKIIESEVPNFKEMIKNKTKKICQEIDRYCVFREKEDYIRQEDSLAQKYLNASVEENKELINRKVIEIINGLKQQDIADEICNIIEDKIYNLFKGSGN